MAFGPYVPNNDFRTFVTDGDGQSAAFSPFSPTLFAVSTGSNYGLNGAGHIYILENTEGGIQEVLRIDYPDNVFDVCWSEEKHNIVACATGDGRLVLYNIGNKFPRVPIQEFKVHPKLEAVSVCWNLPKFSNNILVSSWDGTSCLYDVLHPTWPILKVKTSARGHKTNQSVWSPHSPNTFLTASSDQHLALWDTNTSVQTPQILLRPSNCEVITCDFAKYSDTMVVCGGGDSTIHGFDLRNSSAPLFQLHDHGQAVKRIKFSPYHPTVIASTSYDMTVRIHDFHVSDRSLAVFDYHSEFVHGLDWNLHIKGELVSCAWDKTIKIIRPPFLM